MRMLVVLGVLVGCGGGGQESLDGTYSLSYSDGPGDTRTNRPEPGQMTISGGVASIAMGTNLGGCDTTTAHITGATFGPVEFRCPDGSLYEIPEHEIDVQVATDDDTGDSITVVRGGPVTAVEYVPDAQFERTFEMLAISEAH